MVVAEAALASKANSNLLQPRGYFFVLACARTWRFEHGHALRDRVTHVPKEYSRRCWVPLEEPGRRRTDWTDLKRAGVRQIGAGTIMLSQTRRNDGPNATKILVTNRPDVRARQMVDRYRRRWSVERLMKAWKGATGLGQHPVTKEPQRLERSVAIALMADLMLVKFHAQDIPERGAWRVFTLKRNFTWQIAQAQIARAVEQRLRKGLPARKAA